MKVFVTPHAAAMYTERICARPSAAQAEWEIIEAFARPLFTCPTARGDATLWGLRNHVGYPFTAQTLLADEGAPYVVVQTVGPFWFWHEARPFWRQAGKRAGRRIV